MTYILKTSGLGLLNGFAIGYAFKKISKFVVIIIGIFLILIQLFAYNGIISGNWGIVESTTQYFLSDQGFSFENTKQILLVNLPFAAFAGVGLLIGLNKG